MRQINDDQAAMISALVADKGLSVSEAALEKDIHVSAALTALSKVVDQNFEFVFCGGTCLSKSYGIVERLSEDVDIKVIKKQDSPSMTKSRLKRALSELKSKVQQALINEGFDADQFRECFGVDGKPFETIKAKDENKYIVFSVRYSGRFKASPQLRTQLQLELNFTEIELPPKYKNAVLMIDKLSGSNNPEVVCLKTVDLREVAVEKLVAFARRVAMHMRRTDEASRIGAGQRALDQTLIRHVYDIYEIERADPSIFSDSELISKMMMSVMRKDARDFANQHPEFVEYPVKELMAALDHAKNEPAFKDNFKSFLAEMVYGKDRPDFSVALEAFEKKLNAACAGHGDLSFSGLQESKKEHQSVRRPGIGS